MQVLKRGERSSGTKSPSLRRVGSQLDNSPRASAEHVIFGQHRYATPDLKGKSISASGEIYESWGERDREANSPTRPPSIRRRQSLMLADLETRVESLAAENTALTQDKANVERTLADIRARAKKEAADLAATIEAQNHLLGEKESQITELHKKLDWYREEVQRLTLHNDALNQTNSSLSKTYQNRYAELNAKYEHKQDQLIELGKQHAELETLYNEMSNGVDNIYRQEMEDKDNELERLRQELERAREEVRALQRRVSTRQSDRYLDIKDLPHFAQSSARLFNEVQEWAASFSTVSAGKRIVHVHRITDDAVKDRFENVMLDDRGVRRMLKREEQRPQVFTAILMRLIWEFVFTRYLFGLQVDERQRLLHLERTLGEVGAPQAVHQWRATTLTLLSQRSAFRAKLTTDIEATADEILRHLKFILPPPEHHLKRARTSLVHLLTHAVTLAIEMRTQRAEYVMARAPRPEYDDNGEVANTIPFDYDTMNCMTEDLGPHDTATVKLVLFPLVIRRGNEYGEDYDNQIIVHKMQVLVNRAQLRSESRSTIWREDAAAKQAVSRLTPITDHSPRTTPEHQRRLDLEPNQLPMIPESTVRLVQEEDEEDYERPESPTPAPGRGYRGGATSEKRRRVDG